MAVQKKNGLWFAVVYAGMKNGKQQQLTSKGFDRKDDAILAELDLKRSVIESNRKVYDKESFSYIADKWLGIREKTVANSTFKTNKTYYDTYIKEYFSDSLMTEIEPIDITSFMLQLDKSPATINKVMNILKQIFDFAVTLKQIRYNPCIGIKKPAIKKTKKKTWTEKEIHRFLNLKDTKQATCYLAFSILFATGMRPGEVCGLRWCDWINDYFVPTIGIDKDREVTDLKNEKAHENVYISQSIILLLKKEKAYQESIYREKGLPFPDDGYINSLTPDMRPMTVDYLNKAFSRIIQRNGLEAIRLYDARHSLGTNMMRSGINPKQVAEVLRHSSVKTTLDNYSHVDEKMYKNTINTYNNKIFKRVK